MKNNQEKDIRRHKVLEIVIHSYISTASPVGSRTISRKYRLGLSPASIRNILSELDEMGLIKQPHTSAGRIPTDEGYKYYVNSLMQASKITKDEEDRIGKALNAKIEEVDELIDKTTKILSATTHNIGIALFPRIKRDLFKHIELVPVNNKKAFAVLITTSGLIKEAIIDFDKVVEPQELRNISNFLNQELQNTPISDVKDYILRRILGEKSSFYYMYKFAQYILEFGSLLEDEEKLFLEGTSYIFEQPEFRDYNRMRSILMALEEREELTELLRADMESDGVNIHIGGEDSCDFMKDCSLITSSYKAGGRAIGTLAVLGPTRMEYTKVIPVVRYVSKLVSEILSELSE